MTEVKTRLPCLEGEDTGETKVYTSGSCVDRCKHFTKTVLGVDIRPLKKLEEMTGDARIEKKEIQQDF